jgi:hypothetical protein
LLVAGFVVFDERSSRRSSALRLFRRRFRVIAPPFFTGSDGAAAARLVEMILTPNGAAGSGGP